MTTSSQHKVSCGRSSRTTRVEWTPKATKPKALLARSQRSRMEPNPPWLSGKRYSFYQVPNPGLGFRVYLMHRVTGSRLGYIGFREIIPVYFLIVTTDSKHAFVISMYPYSSPIRDSHIQGPLIQKLGVRFCVYLRDHVFEIPILGYYGGSR